ncbi:MAG: aminomethyl-transferring glycine dehydrogenase [Myxococcales bacterium]|nr:aminomethyl-transferring glycine dehydrogenase [Myxococcales bacterium]
MGIPHGSVPGLFESRHIGPDAVQLASMLETVGCASLDQLIDEAVPRALRFERALDLPAARSEREALDALAELAAENLVFRSFIGMGYHGTFTPPVIQRNVLENPGWYTAYTPYQAEISQGRLEALLVYQTMVQELTGLEIANASLLDEGTAAAEAMTMAHRVSKAKSDRFLVDAGCHPQTIEVVRQRAEPLGIEVVVADPSDWDLETPVFGVLLQYPDTTGAIRDHRELAARVQAQKGLVCVATDLLALTLLTPPGAWGADIAVGNSQRFGVPMGYGGPHAAFFSTRLEHMRKMPGRIIGQSVDADGNPALRMALQTREQHIRREKATSNICTAQVLLANIAGFYGAWHGPEGLLAIATRVASAAAGLAAALRAAGMDVADAFFDTVHVRCADPADVVARARARGYNLRELADGVCIALDETTDAEDLEVLGEVFGVGAVTPATPAIPDALRRTGTFMEQPVFHSHRSETAMMRWLHRLETRDLSLTTSMIPLGSCTMKLNAAAEMMPVTWPGFGALHPFAPREQAAGYARLFDELCTWLAEITGFARVSLQPNAGSQGEYAGMLTIRAFHRANGQADRDVCLIPTSAHGTNPASAVLAGMKVVPVACDDHGNVDVDDLRAKAAKHGDKVAALMITYPSTHGVFEGSVREICSIVHEVGGQVYLDGANMNAMVGLVRPGDLGADVCHLNLHKTFAIPHGGGGPGMGPIAVAAHLAPFLPGHPVVATGGEGGPVSAAPFGSASILVITWAYIAMLGPDGLKRATEVAILNANYIAKRLEGAFDVLYRGEKGRVAHECILDTRPFKADGVSVDDMAKRLMDYGFHAPTMSFPVAGTLMVEPTESEDQRELDRFVAAMLGIRDEIRGVAEGRWPAEDNPLHNAPHTAEHVVSDAWSHPYPRELAAYPAPWLRAHKYWPAVRRVDNAHGDRNVICSCDAWPDEA